jgi:hypothetical protein
MEDDDPKLPMELRYRYALLRATLSMVAVYLELGWFSEADQEALKKRVDLALEADRGPEGSDY